MFAHHLMMNTILATILARTVSYRHMAMDTAGNAKHANTVNKPKRVANTAADERTKSLRIIALNTP